MAYWLKDLTISKLLSVLVALLLFVPVLEGEARTRKGSPKSRQTGGNKQSTRVTRVSGNRASSNQPKLKSKAAEKGKEPPAKVSKATAADKPDTKSNNEATRETPTELAVPQGYEDRTQLLGKCYALRDLGLNEYMHGDYGLAVKHLSQATQLSREYHHNGSPVEALLYLDLAKAADASGQDDIAEQSYKECLRLSPKCADARLLFARLLARKGHVEEAIQEARQAVRTAPEDARTHVTLSLLLERHGQTAAARSAQAAAHRALDAMLDVTVLDIPGYPQKAGKSPDVIIQEQYSDKDVPGAQP